MADVLCPSCEKPSDKPYPESDWCSECSNFVLEDQDREASAPVHPQVFER